MSTMSSIPIPVPKTPKRSDTPATRPMSMPPMIVSVGMYLFSICSIESPVLLKPGTWTSASIRFLATAFGLRPPISTQSRANSTAIPTR